MKTVVVAYGDSRQLEVRAFDPARAAPFVSFSHEPSATESVTVLAFQLPPATLGLVAGTVTPATGFATRRARLPLDGARTFVLDLGADPPSAGSWRAVPPDGRAALPVAGFEYEPFEAPCAWVEAEPMDGYLDTRFSASAGAIAPDGTIVIAGFETMGGRRFLSHLGPALEIDPVLLPPDVAMVSSLVATSTSIIGADTAGRIFITELGGRFIRAIAPPIAGPLELALGRDGSLFAAGSHGVVELSRGSTAAFVRDDFPPGVRGLAVESRDRIAAVTSDAEVWLLEGGRWSLEYRHEAHGARGMFAVDGWGGELAAVFGRAVALRDPSTGQWSETDLGAPNIDKNAAFALGEGRFAVLGNIGFFRVFDPVRNEWCETGSLGSTHTLDDTAIELVGRRILLGVDDAEFSGGMVAEGSYVEKLLLTLD